MSSILSIAVSGLNDAIARVANAANNIVNSSSIGALPTATSGYTGFNPQDVVSISVAGPQGQGGLGVTDTTAPRNPEYTTESDPQSPDANAEGLVGAPNVDLNSELIASKEAQITYGANAKVIKVYDEMEQSLLDALS
jgi:flagellar basal-body rod protein FlgC